MAGLKGKKVTEVEERRRVEGGYRRGGEAEAIILATGDSCSD